MRRYKRSIAACLCGVAGVGLNRGELERAARLFGAAEALNEMTGRLNPDEHYLAKRNIAALREQLDSATLEARWAEGRGLDWEQAVEEALAFAEAV